MRFGDIDSMYRFLVLSKLLVYHVFIELDIALANMDSHFVDTSLPYHY